MNSIASDFKTDGGISGRNEIAAVVLGEEKRGGVSPAALFILNLICPRFWHKRHDSHCLDRTYSSVRHPL